VAADARSLAGPAATFYHHF